MIRQYCCPTCLTPISSKSKNLLHEVEKTKYDLTRAKTNLISLVVGCKGYLLDDNKDRNSSIKHYTLPSLEPDLSSIVFSKNRITEFNSPKHICGKTGYFQIFEKLSKIRVFYIRKFNLFFKF